MEYTLPDLIDIERLKAFLEGFHGTAGVAAGISDRAGKIILSPPMDPFCGDFHRKNEHTAQRCVKSDNILTSAKIQETECPVFTCLNGMNHAVSAIRVAGQHIANIYCGQFLTASPDIEFFRAQAARYGFDERRYLGALAQVPVVNEERLPKLLSFLTSTAAMLGEMGLERLKLREAERSLKKTNDLYSIITEYTRDAVWTMDMNLRITWATPSVVRNRGYSVEELAAMPLEEHLTPASLGRAMEIIATEMTPENLTNGERDLLVRGEFEYTCKGGSTLWADTVAKLQRDKAGNPQGFICSSHDITAWKRTEAALRESEEKYRLVAENVSDIIWTADMDLNFTYISPSVTRIRGYSVGEALAQKLTDRLTPASLQKALDAIVMQTQRRQEGRQKRDDKLTIELEMYSKDGSTVWTENEINYLFGRDGKPIAIVGVTRDISHRKKMEGALRESEERFRSIIQSSSDIIMIFDRQGMVAYESPSTERTLGYPPGYFIGRSAISMVHPDDVERIARDLAEVVQSTNDHIPSEFRFRKADGTWLTMEAVGSNQFHNPGIRGILIVARDVTERKAALKALEAGEERFRLITENSKEVIWMTDMDLRFTYVNAYIEHLLGYTPEEALSCTLQAVLPSSSQELCLNLFFEELENERRGDQPPMRSRTIEVEHFQKNGRTIWAELKMTFLRDASGKAIGILGFTRDITERRLLEAARQSMEERLRRAEKMEALGTMAGGVAHDLNNVLGVLIGYAELMLMDIPEEAPLKNHVSNILKSGERAAAIIQDLLTLARRGVAVSKVVNLNEIVSACLETPEFEKLKNYHPHVTFRCRLGDDLLNVKGSPVHLSKTVMNLASNAAEAIAGTGEVTIVTENRYLDAPIRGYDEVKSGEYAILKVSDTGSGISPADREKIFEPFYTKKVMGRSGTGLGLSVVWGTVKDHDGYIDVESSQETGSVFTIYLPVCRESLSVDGAPVSPESYRGRGETILVVDDVEEQRELAKRMLGLLGYHVATVSSGEEAVAYLRTHRADLLVLDMIMEPGIDGCETYRRVLEIHPRQKAIIASGFSQTERVKEAQRLGAGGYIRKPYLMERIGVAVRNELDRATAA
ncbi:MAG: PAS domain S-box protein [Deltaproteobacteria bacterium]|nr:PAS domain S-box protein [Deltaproteobacteria bacterium]